VDFGVEFAQPCGDLFDAGRDLFGLPGQFPLASVDLVRNGLTLWLPVMRRARCGGSGVGQPPGYDIAHR
jgi:hypothetical protein